MSRKHIAYPVVLFALLLGLLLLPGRPAEAAPPGPATQVAPSGAITITTIAFTWNPAPGATWYLLQVNDAATVGKLVQWYTADQAQCAGGAGTCVVTVTLGLAPGLGTWWIRPWNPEGFGPWSGGLQFTVAALLPAWAATLPAAQRFQLVLGGAAVLDRETGLVWDRSPNTTLWTWRNAQLRNNRIVGKRSGYRLPTLQELASLVDPTQFNPPTLPPGHPFSNVQSGGYWSATTDSAVASDAWRVFFDNATVGQIAKTGGVFVWCVRGGQGVDPQ